MGKRGQGLLSPPPTTQGPPGPLSQLLARTQPHGQGGLRSTPTSFNVDPPRVLHTSCEGSSALSVQSRIRSRPGV